MMDGSAETVSKRAGSDSGANGNDSFGGVTGDINPEKKSSRLTRRLKFPLCAVILQIVFIILLAKFTEYPDDGNATLIAKCDRAKLEMMRSTTDHGSLNGTSSHPPPMSSLNLSQSITTSTTKSTPIVEELDCSAFEDVKEEPVVVFGPPYQDAQFFIVTGLTLLFMAIRNHSMTTYAMCLFQLSMCLQWSFLMHGLLRHERPFHPSPDFFVVAVFFAAAVMISWGVVLGRTSPMQILVMCLLEIPAAIANDYLTLDVFQVNDPGGALVYNMFGTYFGLGVSKMLFRSGEGPMSEKRASTSYSESFAYLGTTVLWGFWPTAMGAIFTGAIRVRCILNTYFALTGSGIIGISLSFLLDNHGKFTNSHIQNAILAGAVAMSGAADTMMGLHSAVVVGVIAGMISVFTWVYIQPTLAKYLNIVDTCGSHTLHGTPAIFGVIVSAITASVASEGVYGSSLYSLFPARAPANNTTELQHLQKIWPHVKPGVGRSASLQACYQIAAMFITFFVALGSGLLTGFLMRQKIFDPLDFDEYYNDATFCNMPEDDEFRHSRSEKKNKRLIGSDNVGLDIDGITTTKF